MTPGMRRTATQRSLVVLAGVLLALGSLSNHWIEAEALPDAVFHQGVLGVEVCGFDLGGDTLEKYARQRETGIPAPPPVWSCDFEFTAPQIGELRKGSDVAFWIASLVCLACGLTASVMLFVAFLRRRSVGKPLAIVVGIGIVAGLAVVTIYRVVESGSSIGYAACLYGAGAAVALWSALRARSE